MSATTSTRSSTLIELSTYDQQLYNVTQSRRAQELLMLIEPKGLKDNVHWCELVVQEATIRHEISELEKLCGANDETREMNQLEQQVTRHKQHLCRLRQIYNHYFLAGNNNNNNNSYENSHSNNMGSKDIVVAYNETLLSMLEESKELIANNTSTLEQEWRRLHAYVQEQSSKHHHHHQQQQQMECKNERVSVPVGVRRATLQLVYWQLESLIQALESCMLPANKHQRNGVSSSSPRNDVKCMLDEAREMCRCLIVELRPEGLNDDGPSPHLQCLIEPEPFVFTSPHDSVAPSVWRKLQPYQVDMLNTKYSFVIERHHKLVQLEEECRVCAIGSDRWKALAVELASAKFPFDFEIGLYRANRNAFGLHSVPLLACRQEQLVRELQCFRKVNKFHGRLDRYCLIRRVVLQVLLSAIDSFLNSAHPFYNETYMSCESRSCKTEYVNGGVNLYQRAVRSMAKSKNVEGVSGLEGPFGDGDGGDHNDDVDNDFDDDVLSVISTSSSCEDNFV